MDAVLLQLHQRFGNNKHWIHYKAVDGTEAFTAPVSKTQVLHLFGFHSMVTTTPDAATTEVYDYQTTPGAVAIEAATELFTTFLGTIPSRTARHQGTRYGLRTHSHCVHCRPDDARSSRADQLVALALS